MGHRFLQKLNKILSVLVIIFFMIPDNSHLDKVPNSITEDAPLLEDVFESREEGALEADPYVYVEFGSGSDGIPIYGDSQDGFRKVSLYASSDTAIPYGYTELTMLQQEYYALIAEAFDQFMEEDYLTKNYRVQDEAEYVTVFQVQKNDADIRDLLKAYWSYRHDHPEHYWISTYYSYLNGDNPSVIVAMDASYAKASVRKSHNRLLEEAVKPYLEAAKGQPDDYGKVLLVHDMIAQAVDYAYDAGGRVEESIWAHNIIGVFEGRGAVCEGYAKSFQLILNQLGIENIYVIGKAAGGAHAWNYVNIDGAYYAIDITWNDIGGKLDGYGGISYQYFCVPGSYFTTSHKAYSSIGNPVTGNWLYRLPKLSNSMECTFYERGQSIASGLTDTAAAEEFISRAEAYADSRYLHILTDETSLMMLSGPLGIQSYIPVKGFGGYYAILIVENHSFADSAASSRAFLAEAEYIFLDPAYERRAGEGDVVLLVNERSAVKEAAGMPGKKVTLYTNLEASAVRTISGSGRMSFKKGKLVVGITSTKEQPVLVKGRIIDAEASRIAKASIRNGVIKITAQRQAGTVYLWVMDTGDAGSACAVPITVQDIP